MFSVEMLPASHGDCLWLEYGTARKRHRVLIDGGPTYSYKALAKHLEARLGRLPKRERRIDLVVITHIDSDHIGGIFEFLLADTAGITIGDVWFNGWDHLPDAAPDALGAVQGEQVSALLEDRLPWNEAFDGGAVVVPASGTLPVVSLPGGMTLTLLSPTLKELAKLRPQWKRTVEKAGLVAGSPDEALDRLREKGRVLPSDLLGEEEAEIIDPVALAEEPFKPDTSVANGSSIALLAEYDGKSCLLAGDALAGVLTKTVKRLAQERGESRLEIDALKVSHHGGQKNTSSTLLDHLHCQTYLFSTDGSRFGHPHPQSVARALVAGGSGTSLRFNYRTPVNEVWDDPALKETYTYETDYPADGEEGLVVKL